MTDATLLTTFKSRIETMAVNIVDEDLTPYNTSYLRYNSLNPLWETAPQERIRIITAGVETYIFPASYTINAAGGYVTFSVAKSATDTIRADYSYFPFTDSDLTSILGSARGQIGGLIFRTITEPYNEYYQEIIMKRAYSICLRKMQLPTVKYFSVSVGGRTMDKSNQVTNTNALIESNEKEVSQELNALRYYNKDNVLS